MPICTGSAANMMVRQQPLLQIGDQSLINFCSNDYLGLANHPQIADMLCRTAQHNGVGSGASHLLNGHHYQHHTLEQELAEFLQCPRVLLFSTGYMANLAVLTALSGKNDSLLQDRLNHASLIDAARLSQASMLRLSA